MKGLGVGDSTLVSASHLGIGGAYSGVSPWSICAIAEQMMNEKFGSGALEFNNVSHGGTDYRNWLYGEQVLFLPKIIPDFASLLNANPDAELIYIHLGINNALRGHTAAGVVTLATEMHRIATAKGRKIIFGTPNPTNHGNPVVNSLVAQYAEALVKMGQTLNVPVVDHYRAIAATNVWWRLLKDGLHPNEELYRFMGQTLFMTLAHSLLF